MSTVLKNGLNAYRSKFIVCLFVFGLSLLMAATIYVNAAQAPMVIRMIQPPYGPPNDRVFVEFIDRFSATYKDIKLERIALTSSGSEYHNKVTILLASGIPVDIVWGEPFFLETLYEQGALIPVTEFIKQTPNRYFPALLQEFRYGDKLIGVPFECGDLLLWYLPEIFDAAGLPSPRDYAKRNDWTWETFRFVLRRLAVDKNGDGVFERVGLTIEPFLYLYMPFFWQAGAEEFNQDFTKSGWDSQEAVEAMQYIWSLIWKEKVVSLAPPVGGILGGNQAMRIDGTHAEGRYANLDPKWNAAPLPIGRKRATKSLAKGLGILKSSPEREVAAWKVIERLTADSHFLPEWVVRTGYLPVTETALQNDRFVQYVKVHPDILVGFQEIPYARNFALTPGIPGNPPSAQDTFTSIIRGEKPVEIALRQYADMVNNWISTQRLKK